VITHRLNPATLYEIPGIAQVTVASGTRLIHVSGQAAFTPAGDVVGTTHRAQALQSLRNLTAAVMSAGASQADIVSMTMYVVNYNNDALESIYAAFADIAAETETEPSATAASLVGVTCLWHPELLIEIAATAIA
jgi:enamine deaminase RidA (YjgF/YER057c/UK114 family)